ncbi:MAG: right-handed parallel beta-helix repeat-containing protein [Myxococcales bacterium]|nr:right-handed parallel beta-helix repeat-containing protein [Myxococcales bacterium]
MRRPPCLVLAALILMAPATAFAADWYVDPTTGDPSGDGSAARPWGTLQEVVEAGLIETRHWTTLPYAPGATLGPVNAGAPIQPGDTIWLADGYHGELSITGGHNAAPIVIRAMDGATPRLSRVLLRAASQWELRGLSISPSHAPTYARGTALDIDDHGFHGPSHDIVVEGCDIFAMPDISGLDAAGWVSEIGNGVAIDGADCVFRDNTVRNIDFGISVTGERVAVIGNLVENFSGDGMRGLGDYGRFEGNVVRNCYDVDDNHDDGFQSWSNGPDGVGSGEVVGIVLRGNTIINRVDPAQPLQGPLQGIGCFDGFFTDWVVENNVVITDHWHGITLLGARDSRIVNNTVIDVNTVDPGPPWIRIDDHKDGTASTGNVIRNNLAASFHIGADPSNQSDHNFAIVDASALFVDAAGFDLHLLPTATDAIDQGVDTLAPAFDFDGIPRPQGAAHDLGAFEWHDGTVMPVDAGPPGPDAGPGDDGGTAPADGGPSASDDGGTAGADAGSASGGCDGCACRAATSRRSAPLVLLSLLGALFLRRRR